MLGSTLSKERWREIKKYISADGKAGIKVFSSADDIMLTTIVPGKSTSVIIPKSEARKLFSSLLSDLGNSREDQDKVILDILMKRANVEKIDMLDEYKAVLNEFVQVMPKITRLKDFDRTYRRPETWIFVKKV